VESLLYFEAFCSFYPEQSESNDGFLDEKHHNVLHIQIAVLWKDHVTLSANRREVSIDLTDCSSLAARVYKTESFWCLSLNKDEEGVRERATNWILKFWDLEGCVTKMQTAEKCWNVAEPHFYHIFTCILSKKDVLYVQTFTIHYSNWWMLRANKGNFLTAFFYTTMIFSSSKE